MNPGCLTMLGMVVMAFLASIFARRSPRARYLYNYIRDWLACGTGGQLEDRGRYNFGPLSSMFDVQVNPNGGQYSTLAAALGAIPANTNLSRGYRINLWPTSYAEETSFGDEATHYRGTFDNPIIIQSDPSATGRAVLTGSLDIAHASYVYLLNIDVVNDPNMVDEGNAVHFAFCDNVLISNCLIDGGTRIDPARREATTRRVEECDITDDIGNTRRGLCYVPRGRHEALKVNQCKYVYVENCRIRGAWDNAVDFVAVQYGHVLDNEISDSLDWGMYTKGGSAYLRIERNFIHDCVVGGYTAGQGTGFQFMVVPWLNYEVYGIRFLNNIIYNTAGAGMGVHGGYNILLAYNTLCRVGLGATVASPPQPDGSVLPEETSYGSHLIEVGYGARACDDYMGSAEAREICQDYHNRGGWGSVSEEVEGVPNRHVYICNNIVYNPDGEFSRDHHFQVPRRLGSPPVQLNLHSEAWADDDLQIKGNLIWNELPSIVPPDARLFGGGDHGCQDGTTCSPSAIAMANLIHEESTAGEDRRVLRNTVRTEPLDTNNFRPIEGGIILDSRLHAVPLPDFVWDGLPIIVPSTLPIPGELAVAPEPEEGLWNEPRTLTATSMWQVGGQSQHYTEAYRSHVLFDYMRNCRDQGGLPGAFKRGDPRP